MKSANPYNYSSWEGGNRICHERKVRDNYAIHKQRLDEIQGTKSALGPSRDRSMSSILSSKSYFKDTKSQ